MNRTQRNNEISGTTRDKIAIEAKVAQIARQIKKKLYFIVGIFLTLFMFFMIGTGYLFFSDREEFKQKMETVELLREIVKATADIHEEYLIMIKVVDEEARTTKGDAMMTPYEKSATAKTIQECVQKYYPSSNQTTSLIFGIIKQESGWNPKAVSYGKDKDSGKIYEIAYGLMQIRWPTAKMCAELMKFNGIDDIELNSHEDLFDPVKNIKIGCFYYNYLYQTYKDPKYTLHAYYAGQYWTDKSKQKGKVLTWGYGHVDLVNSHAKNYQKRGIS